MCMSNEHNSGSTLLAFLVGLVTGTILGILFAPAEGKETRKKLVKYLEEIEDKGEDFIEEGKKFISEGAKKVKTIIEEGKEKLEKKFSKEPSEE